MTDEPLVAYQNELQQGGTLTLTVGTEVVGFPLINAFDKNILSLCKVTPVAGVVELNYVPPYNLYQNGFGVGGFGLIGFGGYIQTPIPMSCLILGGARHSADGERTVPLNTLISVAQTVGGALTQVVNSNATALDVAAGSKCYLFDQVQVANATIRLTFDPALTEIVLPELFFGDTLRLPFADFGFDPYHEVTYGTTFVSESGREYPQVRYRRTELTPKFSNIERAKWDAVDLFRENVTEVRAPFWFAWSPMTLPNETYLMREDGKDLAFPIAHTNYRNLTPKFVEVL